MSHKDESPHKVEAIKKYLMRVFPNHQVHHFFEPERSLQSFRVEDAGCGLISLGEDYFFDLPDDEDGIFRRLNEARLPHAVREFDSNTRILLVWDEEHLGQPKIRPEILNPARKPRK